MSETLSTTRPHFAAAERALTELQQEESFLARLDRFHLDLSGAMSPEYWRIVEDFATETYPEKPDETTEQALSRLTLLTPSFMLTQHILNMRRNTMSFAELDDRVSDVSFFNTQVRRVAEADPTIRPSELKDHLVGIIERTLMEPEITADAPRMIDASIRGAQHELGFTQLVLAAGYDVTEATTRQDVGGTDRIITDQNGIRFNVDVKASRYDLWQKSTEQYLPFKITEKGHIIIWSQLESDDFGDRFFISDETAIAKSAKLKKLFKKIRQSDRFSPAIQAALATRS